MSKTNNSLCNIPNIKENLKTEEDYTNRSNFSSSTFSLTVHNFSNRCTKNTSIET